MIEKDGNNHYVLMQDLSPFVDKKHEGKTYSCRYCLHSIYRKELLKNYEPNCCVHSPVRLEFPEFWQKIEFLNYSAQIWHHPFVIYADFESTHKKIYTIQPNPEQS